MSGAFAVASREVRERRGVLGVAALSGLLLLLLRVLLPAGRSGPDVGLFFAVAVVVALPIAVGLTLGASVIARDVAEGRLGFYFARPLSGLDIWAGKMGAAVVLTLAATALVTAIASPVFPTGLPPVGPAPGYVLLFLIVVPLVCVIVAHVGAVLLRSRSGLLPYDLAAGVAVLAALAWLGRLLLGVGTRKTAEIAIPPLVLGTLAALVIAGAAQVLAGRGDARRGHRALSRTLWGSVAALLAVLGLFVAWVLGISPSSPGVRPIVGSSPDGAYVVTYLHERAGHEPVFLVHGATGRFLRLEALQTGVRFTADGKTAVWAEKPPFGTRSLVKARLEGPEPVVTRTELSEPGWLWPLALSEDGSRVLLNNGSTLSVRETATARAVAQAPLGSYVRGATFVGAGRVRVYRNVDGLIVSDWDLQSGKVIERVHIVGSTALYDVRGGRMIVVRSASSGGTLEIYDIEAGRLQVTFPTGDQRVDFARWLDDGRVVVVSSPRFDDDARLRIFDASGQEIAATPLASPARSRSLWRWGGQAGDTLVLGYHNRERESYETVFADARTAAVKRREPHIMPVFPPWWSGHGAGETRSRRPILYFERGRVVTVDPATGARTRVPWQG